MQTIRLHGMRLDIVFNLMVSLNEKRRSQVMMMRMQQIFMGLVIWCCTLAVAFDAMAFQVGPLKVGGAIRANYVIGDYENEASDGPQRGGNGGNFELDTFRINLDYKQDGFIGKVEYRFYDGYNFLHTGWVGYDFANNSQIQVGVNRVPFGVGAYGPANSWFFDQHYYVGLSDDMDLGVKYRLPLGEFVVDLAYYVGAEFEGRGDSDGSARYSYDIIDDDSVLGGYPYGRAYASYEEQHQFNVRGTYTFSFGEVTNTAGISLQWGQLDSQTSDADDSDAYAYSAHTKSSWGPWTLMLQLSYYDYDTDYTTGANSDLIAMGAYDFAWPVAAEGTIPAVALSYTWKPEMIDWIDTITFYNDYSIIIKDGQQLTGEDFNDSAMNVTGMAIASGGWYIYVDFAYSNGNYFVGNDDDTYASFADVSDFGINGRDDWDSRFNINFGYYF